MTNIQLVREFGDWLAIKIAGRFDHESSAAFRQAYADCPTRIRIIVDLSQTTHIDSAALGMLLVLREHVGDDPQRVVIRGALGQPLEALKMAHFTRLFTFQGEDPHVIPRVP